MGSQASEMKAGRSHTLLTTATLTCGEVEPTQSQLRKSPFAVLLGISAAWRFQAHAEVRQSIPPFIPIPAWCGCG